INWFRSALDGQPEGFSSIVDPERDVLNTVTVLMDVRGDLAVRSERGGEHQSHLPLRENVARSVACAGLGAAVSDDLVAEDASIELRRLLGVADVELYEIRSVDRKGICDLFRCRKCRGSHDFSGFRRVRFTRRCSVCLERAVPNGGGGGGSQLKVANRAPQRGDSNSRRER